jgi:hypothetical protein
MSLKNPPATKKCMGLPYVPLPHVFANMSLNQVFNKNQLQSWQEGYMADYKSGHLEG